MTKPKMLVIPKTVPWQLRVWGSTQ